MADFESAVSIVLDLEGGLGFNKFDKGGITKYGISLNFLKGLNISEADFNHDGIIDGKDIVELTLDQAKALYLKYFWQRSGICNIHNQAIATIIFDMAVNSGAGVAVRVLQTVLNNLSNANLLVDGKLGEKTAFACNHYLDTKKLYLAIQGKRQEFYITISGVNNQAIFLGGWFNRLKLLNEKLLKDASV